MALDRITLAAFRNHRASAIDGTGQFNLLVGENGAGKTNVLEAISLFAPGRGLRRAALTDMAGSSGPGGFTVSARLAQPGGAEPVALGTGTEPAQPSRRLVQINGASASAVSLGEWLALTWLTPAMDRLALALDPGHARIAARHEAALRERNRLLSGPHDPDPRWLDAVEGQLAQAGAALAQGRAALVARLSAELATLPEEPFALPLLAYVPGGPLEADALAEALAAGRRRDRAAQRTLTGPQRDELEVTMAGKGGAGKGGAGKGEGRRGQPAALCSTGEQKAMLIAITLAHAALAAGERPGLLLLDEVAAHLDPLRRAALFDRLRSGKAQIWLTGTELAPFAEIREEAACWHVTAGEVTRV
ncbi:MAG TPA: AAA family ATPase [Sphingomonadaceae bacterium]|nr:AAA family ATPase [Sphingomonadaceae bacterium]